MRRRFAILVLAFGLCGCAGSPPPVVPVEGTITLNGLPLADAEVQFVPMTGFGAEFIARAVTDKDGRFKLETNNGQAGACACLNRVTVTEGPIPDGMRGQSAEAQVRASKYLAGLKNRPIPPTYGTLATSVLEVTVVTGQTEYPLKLSR